MNATGTFTLPTNTVLDAAVLAELKSAAAGKDQARRPKALTAYQIAARLPTAVASPFITSGGFGGKGGGGNGMTLTQAVQHACKRLANQNLVRVRYMDCGGLVFQTQVGPVIPSYPVCGVYQYSGPVAVTARGVAPQSGAEDRDEAEIE